jgi:hypothetical protein
MAYHFGCQPVIARSNAPLGLGILTNTELSYRTRPIPQVPSSSSNNSVPNIREYGPEVHTAFREMSLRVPTLHHPQPHRLGANSQTEAHMIPLPEQTQEEIAMTDAPLTPMEELELDNGVFGSAPLEVNGGAAVMEESVDFRVADVVTQF